MSNNSQVPLVEEFGVSKTLLSQISNSPYFKKFDSKGNKTNWNDIEEFHYIYEDIEYVSSRVVSYSEPEVYGDELVETTYFDLKDLQNIEDLEILDHLKFKIRKAKIQNIIQDD